MSAGGEAGSERVGELEDYDDLDDFDASSDPEDVRAEVVSESEAAQAVEHDLDALVRERDEYLETLRHLQADFENYKKRVERDHTARVSRANEVLVAQLLDVLDSFELAVSHLEDGTDVDKLRKGVEQVYAQLLASLERVGLERMDTDGAVFDPEQHEAVLHEESDEPSDVPTIVETMRTGYRFNGRVIRPPMVKVTR